MKNEKYLIDLNDVENDLINDAKNVFKSENDKVVVRDDFSFLTLSIQSNNLNKIKSFLKNNNKNTKIYDCVNSIFIN